MLANVILMARAIHRNHPLVRSLLIEALSLLPPLAPREGSLPIGARGAQTSAIRLQFRNLPTPDEPGKIARVRSELMRDDRMDGRGRRPERPPEISPAAVFGFKVSGLGRDLASTAASISCRPSGPIDCASNGGGIPDPSRDRRCTLPRARCERPRRTRPIGYRASHIARRMGAPSRPRRRRRQKHRAGGDERSQRPADDIKFT